MRRQYATLGSAIRAARVLARKYRRTAYVTRISTGDYAGFFTVTPDVLSTAPAAVLNF